MPRPPSVRCTEKRALPKPSVQYRYSPRGWKYSIFARHVPLNRFFSTLIGVYIYLNADWLILISKRWLAYRNIWTLIGSSIYLNVDWLIYPNADWLSVLIYIFFYKLLTRDLPCLWRQIPPPNSIIYCRFCYHLPVFLCYSVWWCHQCWKSCCRWINHFQLELSTGLLRRSVFGWALVWPWWSSPNLTKRQWKHYQRSKLGLQVGIWSMGVFLLRWWTSLLDFFKGEPIANCA